MEIQKVDKSIEFLDPTVFNYGNNATKVPQTDCIYQIAQFLFEASKKYDSKHRNGICKTYL